MLGISRHLEKAETTSARIAREDCQSHLLFDALGRMLVLNDDDLAILTVVLDEIVVKALFQVCTSQSAFTTISSSPSGLK